MGSGAGKIAQRAENYKRAVKYLDECGELTREKLAEVFRIAGVDMSKSKLREVWNEADLQVSLRNDLIKGIAHFQEVASHVCDVCHTKAQPIDMSREYVLLEETASSGGVGATLWTTVEMARVRAYVCLSCHSLKLEAAHWPLHPARSLRDLRVWLSGRRREDFEGELLASLAREKFREIHPKEAATAKYGPGLHLSWRSSHTIEEAELWDERRTKQNR